MALIVEFNVGNDKFKAEGDFDFSPAMLEVVKVWTRALDPDAEEVIQDQLNALGERIGQNTTGLAASVDETAGELDPQPSFSTARKR